MSFREGFPSRQRWRRCGACWARWHLTVFNKDSWLREAEVCLGSVSYIKVIVDGHQNFVHFPARGYTADDFTQWEHELSNRGVRALRGFDTGQRGRPGASWRVEFGLVTLFRLLKVCRGGAWLGRRW